MLSELKTIPPVPKFNLDLIFQDEQEETIIQTQTKSDQRRIKEVRSQIELIVDKLDLGEMTEIIKKRCYMMLTQQIVCDMKSKKYQSIAGALAIHALSQESMLITRKQVYSILDLHEKQVTKILQYLQQKYPVDKKKLIQGQIAKMCLGLKFTHKFQEICTTFFDELLRLNLIQGEHENVVSAMILKFCGDIAFNRQGGLQLATVLQVAGCCELSIKNFYKKLQPYQQEMIENVYKVHF
ncbi:hypothetical protein pb186bvf_000695 [Paramecium bursaria]